MVGVAAGRERRAPEPLRAVDNGVMWPNADELMDELMDAKVEDRGEEESSDKVEVGEAATAEVKLSTEIGENGTHNVVAVAKEVRSSTDTDE